MKITKPWFFPLGNVRAMYGQCTGNVRALYGHCLHIRKHEVLQVILLRDNIGSADLAVRIQMVPHTRWARLTFGVRVYSLRGAERRQAQWPRIMRIVA